MAEGEREAMIDDLERGYRGDAWHGPSLRSVLEGVTAATAAASPIPGGHSIWEIVVHLAAWDDVIVRRIESGEPISDPEGGNFPPVGPTDPGAWDAALRLLDARHDRLVQMYEELADLTRRQARQIDELRAGVERFKAGWEQSRRAGKRQAAPSSKGSPKAGVAPVATRGTA